MVRRLAWFEGHSRAAFVILLERQIAPSRAAVQKHQHPVRFFIGSASGLIASEFSVDENGNVTDNQIGAVRLD